ncbi:MAG: diguanylate cyclase [Armatimonadota bacterium]
MVDELLTGIINCCLAIDRQSAKAYQLLAAQTDEVNLSELWSDMAGEEYEHVAYWEHMLPLAEAGAIPQVFDRPAEALTELQTINADLEQLIARTAVETPGQAFLLAYQMEYSLLHPAFATLFHYHRMAIDRQTPEDDYEAHLLRLRDAAERYQVASPELTLLGETLLRIWRENRRLTLQSFTDSLSGLLNRRGLHEAMIPFAYFAQRNRDNIAMMLIDIDHFRLVNEQYGLQVGDDVLRNISGILRTQTRRSDLLGRYNGAAFLLFLPSVSPGALQFVADKLCRRVERETRNSVPITLSIGAVQGVLRDDVEREVTSFVRQAELNLAEAKRMGGNMAVTSNMDPHAMALIIE